MAEPTEKSPAIEALIDATNPSSRTHAPGVVSLRLSSVTPCPVRSIVYQASVSHARIRHLQILTDRSTTQ